MLVPIHSPQPPKPNLVRKTVKLLLLYRSFASHCYRSQGNLPGTTLKPKLCRRDPSQQPHKQQLVLANCILCHVDITLQINRFNLHSLQGSQMEKEHWFLVWPPCNSALQSSELKKQRAEPVVKYCSRQQFPNGGGKQIRLESCVGKDQPSK